MAKIALILLLKVWLDHRRHNRTKVVKWSRLFPESEGKGGM